LDEAAPPPRPIAVPLAAAEAEDAADAAGSPDGQRRLVLQRAPSEAGAPARAESNVDHSAADDPLALDDEAGALHALRALLPGAHAVDGVLPWGHLVQGFGRADVERLRRA